MYQQQVPLQPNSNSNRNGSGNGSGTYTPNTNTPLNSNGVNTKFNGNIPVAPAAAAPLDPALSDVIKGWHDDDAERGVVCLAYQDYDYYSQLHTAGIRADWFDNDAARYIWQLFSELYNSAAGEVSDYEVINHLNRNAGDLAKGYLEYYRQVNRLAPTASYIPVYTDRLLTSYKIREIYKQMQRTLNTLSDGYRKSDAKTVDGIIAQLEDSLIKIKTAAAPINVVTSQQMADLTLAEYELALSGQTEAETMPAETLGINHATDGGWALGEVYIVSGKQANGKTAFVQREAFWQAIEQGRVGGFVSLEMRRKNFVSRYVQQETGIGTRDLTNGRFEHCKEIVLGKLDKLGKQGKLYLVDNPRATVETLFQTADFIFRREGKLDFMCVDYAQILDRGSKWQNDIARMDYISGSLSEIAKMYGCTVWAISRLSRNGEINASSQFEYDAENLVRIDNPCTGKDVPVEKKSGTAHVIFEKQRFGKAGFVADMYWDASWTRFRDLDTRHDF